MNVDLFIAKRLIKSKDFQNNISGPIVSIAIVGIALGLIVMIMSVAIVTGFKEEIRNKVFGFSSHIQIINYDANVSYETKPVDKVQPFISDIKKIKGVKHMQVFATKAGIIKTKNDIEGVFIYCVLFLDSIFFYCALCA